MKSSAKYSIFQKIVDYGELEDFMRYAVYSFLTQKRSLFNSALAYLQRMGSSYLLSEEKWLECGRQLKPNAIPIVLMQPFGPVTFVYDILDTEGNRFPKGYVPFKDFIEPEPQPISDDLFPKLKQMCVNMGVQYYEMPLGELVGGFATNLSMPVQYVLLKSRKKKVITTWYAVVVNSYSNNTAKTHVLLHELGHILCGHITLSDAQREKSTLKVPLRPKGELTLNKMEWEADKTCEFVGRLLGYRYNADKYLSGYGYTRLNNEEPGALRAAMDAADRIVKSRVWGFNEFVNEDEDANGHRGLRREDLTK
jgi:hypothetical protein